MKIPFWLKVVIGILVCNGIGILASLITLPAIPEWYAGLNKPFFTPPNWLFGPVWTLLYTAMGVSAAAIWQQGFDKPEVKHALAVFIAQLMMNGMWSFLFFGFQNTGLALVEIVALWLAILLTIIRFKEIKAWTAWLLIPYLLWVSYAAALNIGIFMLN